MKIVTKSVRMTESEANKLKEGAQKANMTESQYLRTLIMQNQIQIIDQSTEIAAKACQIYILLSEAGLSDNDTIMQEVNKLCQIL